MHLGELCSDDFGAVNILYDDVTGIADDVEIRTLIDFVTIHYFTEIQRVVIIFRIECRIIVHI